MKTICLQTGFPPSHGSFLSLCLKSLTLQILFCNTYPLRSRLKDISPQRLLVLENKSLPVSFVSTHLLNEWHWQHCLLSFFSWIHVQQTPWEERQTLPPLPLGQKADLFSDWITSSFRTKTEEVCQQS